MHPHEFTFTSFETERFNFGIRKKALYQQEQLGVAVNWIFFFL